MKLIKKGQVLVGIFPALKVVAPGLEVFTTTRTGGISPPPFNSLNLSTRVGDRKTNVLKNKQILSQALDIKLQRIAMGEQVHSSKVQKISKPGLYSRTDGLITREENLYLVVSTADCFPLVLYSPPERVLSILHVGSNGLAEGIVENCLNILVKDFRVDTSNIVAIIGPGICRKCYSVNKLNSRKFPPRSLFSINGKTHLDIEKAIKIKLRSFDIKSHNIYSSRLCTSCNEELFFSYRRDSGKTGRHWTVATIVSK